MTTVEFPLVSEWTPDVLDRLPDAYRYEVKEGKLVVVAAAAQRAWHSDMEFRVVALLRNQGRFARHEVGIILQPGEVRTADVAVFGEPPNPDTGYLTAAAFTLLVEVVSPGSERDDRELKPREYAQAGVPEYWRVERDGDDGIVYQYALTTAGSYAETGVVALSALETAAD